eukprot:7455395-Alexandrium_andersonii.AAC.1
MSASLVGSEMCIRDSPCMDQDLHGDLGVEIPDIPVILPKAFSGNSHAHALGKPATLFVNSEIRIPL